MLFFVGVFVCVCVICCSLFPFAEGEVFLSGVFCECDVGVCLEVERFFFAAVLKHMCDTVFCFVAFCVRGFIVRWERVVVVAGLFRSLFLGVCFCVWRMVVCMCCCVVFWSVCVLVCVCEFVVRRFVLWCVQCVET